MKYQVCHHPRPDNSDGKTRVRKLWGQVGARACDRAEASNGGQDCPERRQKASRWNLTDTHS